jgi:CDP-diacylglycerol--glycerol-3-phosphate 3-phosphatidyltransferase|tara:strand:+ start:417 stop:953 length:537 start_codon:yes stop_codon:yes gene_type:complete
MNNFIQFLTYFRIISGPIIFILIVISNLYGTAFILFLFASFSDYWDGYLARKYQLVSVMGEVLDPIADKILITFVIIALAISLESSFIAFIGSIILSREFWVAALRDFNARNGNINATKVSFIAKLKTAIQLTTLGLYLYGLFLNSALLIFIADFSLLATMLITIQTGLTYSIASFKR